MTLETLKAALKGQVIWERSQGFDAARAALLWNGRKPDAEPKLIVKAAGVPDVIATIRFAAEHGLRISPKGGGHNFSGIARQGGIVLDLSGLNRVWIDAGARIAEVGPGVTNGDLAAALEAQGLAFPVGHCATVPMSGYLLGGGVGWNSGAWGFGFASVDSIDVVLADGILRRVSERDHPDIFWAARGAGPEFFGAIVGYRLRLQTLPRAITTVVRVYPLDAVAEVFAWKQAVMAEVPSTVEFTTAMTSAQGSGGAVKVALAIATVFADDPAEASEIHARIAARAPAGALAVEPEAATPFAVLYDIIGRFLPVGHRYAVDSAWADAGAADYVTGLARAIATAPSAETFALEVSMPPGRPVPPDAAFSKHPPVWGCIYTIWDRPEDDVLNLGWLRDAADRVEPFVTGHYLGEADLERPERRNVCHAPEALGRLRALQAVHDPRGLFLRPIPEIRAADPVATAA